MKLSPKNIITFGGPLQTIYSLKLLWIGIAGLLGVRYIVSDLNYLTVLPVNVIVLIAGLWGIFGVLSRCYFCNFLFALFNFGLYIIITMTFYFHPPEFISISMGQYATDVIGSFLLMIVWLRMIMFYRRYSNV